MRSSRPDSRSRRENARPTCSPRSRRLQGAIGAFGAGGRPRRRQTFSSITRTSPTLLKRRLAALRPLTRGQLVVAFGCGGDRDRGKRPLMGAIAARDADTVVLVTDDNPRSESAAAIRREILAGTQRRQRPRDRNRRPPRGDRDGRGNAPRRRQPGRRGQGPRNRPDHRFRRAAVFGSRGDPGGIGGHRRASGHDRRASVVPAGPRATAARRTHQRRVPADARRRAFRSIRARSQPGDLFVASAR